MEKHVPMNPAWFEPGPDGVSPFERLSATVGFGAAGTAAAFRALLAGEEQPQVFVDLSTTPDTTRAVMADANGNVLQEVTIEQLAQLGIVTNPTPPAHAVGQQPVDVGVRDRREHEMSEIDHEAAKVKAEFCQSYPALFKKQEANLCRAYIDSQKQLAAERARVQALKSALKEAIELSAACIIHSKSAEEVVATVNHLTAILNARVPEVCAILESPHA